MSGLYSDVFVERLRVGAESLLAEWGLSPQTRVSLLNVSENATFRADDPQAGAPVVLRVHRPGYHTSREIESELAWIQDLRERNVAEIPAPLPCASGGHIASFDLDGAPRDVVAFAFVEGHEPAPDSNLTGGFRELGAISARLHLHARSWQRPVWFKRKTWDFDATVGRVAFWGDWHDALGLTASGSALLTRTVEVLQRRLSVCGQTEDRFGLIHADLRLANLLIDRGRIKVIDFDDCGFGWFVFDFAAAISFIETDPIVPDLQAAWVAGYRDVTPLDPVMEREIPTFVMLRRLQLTAWIASHAETPTAKELGPTYTDGSLALADKYLSGANLSIIK